jgi:hypothetical protein
VTVFNPYFGSLEVVAQSGVNKFVQKLFCDFGQSCLFNSLVDLAIQTAGYVSILSTIYGGYLILLSNFGMDREYAKARNILTGGIIGLVVVYMARPLTMAIVGSLNQQQDQFGIEGLIIVTNNFIIQSGVAFLIGTSSALALLSIVYGGYILIFDSFTDGKTKKARKIIQNGVTGLLVVLLAGPIIDTIINASALKTGADGNFDLSGTARALANNIGILLINFLQYLVIPLSSIVTVYAIITAGYKFVVVSATDSNKAIKEGVEGIRGALIGLIIILGSFTIVQAVIVILPTSPQGILQNSSQVANSSITNPLPTNPPGKIPGSGPGSSSGSSGSRGPGGSSGLPKIKSPFTTSSSSKEQQYLNRSSLTIPTVVYGDSRVRNWATVHRDAHVKMASAQTVSGLGVDQTLTCPKRKRCDVKFYAGINNALKGDTAAKFEAEMREAVKICKGAITCTLYHIPEIGNFPDSTRSEYQDMEGRRLSSGYYINARRLVFEYNKKIQGICNGNSSIQCNKKAVIVGREADTLTKNSNSEVYKRPCGAKTKRPKVSGKNVICWDIIHPKDCFYEAVKNHSSNPKAHLESTANNCF